MRLPVRAGQWPQQIGDFRAWSGYGLAVQVSKGQTASGVRIATDPADLLAGGGITLDPALGAGTSGGSFTFQRFSDRLFAVVDTGATDIFVDLIRWKVEGDFDPRKQTVYGGFEEHPDLSKRGSPQPR